MSAFIVLIAAALSRVFALHAHSWNFTALGGGLLFFGSRMAAPAAQANAPRWHAPARLAAALAILIATDFGLTTLAYHYPFRPAAYLVTWIWYAAVCCLGMGILARPSLARAAVATLASATSFFLLSNFAVWAGSAMYPHTMAGLAACYSLALPFYRNDLASTALTVAALFGLPALARRMTHSLHTAQPNHLA